MKIRTTKKLNLPELIQYVWEKDIEDTDFFSNEKLPSGQKVKLHVNPRDFNYGESRKKAGVSLKSHGFVVDDRYTFTVTVEEELTEETEFDELWEVYYHKSDGEINTYKNYETYGAYSTTISQIMQENSIDDDTITLAVYYGSTLIWSKDIGIPESGVLDVDSE